MVKVPNGFLIKQFFYHSHYFLLSHTCTFSLINIIFNSQNWKRLDSIYKAPIPFKYKYMHVHIYDITRVLSKLDYSKSTYAVFCCFRKKTQSAYESTYEKDVVLQLLE